MDLVVRCAVALGGPRVGRRAGEVPDTTLGDGVGQGEEGVVEGGTVGFGGEEDKRALQVDAVQWRGPKVRVVANERPQGSGVECAVLHRGKGHDELGWKGDGWAGEWVAAD